MKKNKKSIVIKYLVLLFLFCLNLVVHKIEIILSENGKITESKMVFLTDIYNVINGLFLFTLIIFFIIEIISAVKSFTHLRSINLIEYIGQPIFKKIDAYKRELTSNNLFYLNGVRFIKEIYDNEISKYVIDKNIEELYKRRNFVKNKIEIDNDIVTIYSSLVVSVITSIIFNLGSENQNIAVIIMSVIFACIAFFAILLFKFMLNGQDTGFKNELVIYEISLLDKFITNIIEKLEELNNETDLNKNNRNILTILAENKYNIKHKIIKRKQIKTIKKIIEELQDETKYENINTNLYIKIYIKEKDIYFYLDSNKVNKDYIKYKKKQKSNSKKITILSIEEFVISNYSEENYEDIFQTYSFMVYKCFKELHMV